MVWGTAEVMDTVALQHLLEMRLAAPVRVLPAIVRQHLLGYPVFPRRTPVYLHHVLRRLRTVESQSHHVPGIIVNEPDQVGHLSAQMKRKNVALPHLVRRAALEKTRLRGITLRLLLCHRHHLFGVQRPPYRTRARRQEKHPPQQLRDPLHPKLGIRPLDLNDLRLDRRQCPGLFALQLRMAQPYFALRTVAPDPPENSRASRPDFLRHQSTRNPFL